jgi:proton-translocating NAD(P)+ transhydrogenase subunit beta
MTLLIDFSVIIILIMGIWQFRHPRGARIGNLMAAFALLAAFVLVLYRNGVVDVGTAIFALLAGAITGYAVARAVNMIQIPSMVAFQHGAGGVAAFLISFVELTRDAHTIDLVSEISGVLGLTIGSLTFSGSIIASAKLANKMRQTPQVWPAHQTLLFLNLGALLAIGVITFYVPADIARYLYLTEIVLSATFGILFSVRIGGADMPVLISFLNATAGLAAALCGMVIGNQLLIAFGATVAASGSILTHVMCKAMNRNIIRVIWPSLKDRTASPKRNPIASPFTAKTTPQETAAGNLKDDLSTAIEIIKKSKKVIIIPGYGMALAKAQQEVAALANKMVSMSKEVKYAIHPVAGRMPGHMNVLLAEAGVDYDMLVEMEHINSDFPDTDLALVIGACDVVNPAAIDIEGTPISGMPILMAHKAKHVICCNFDKKPGYSGVENPLYQKTNTITLLGDANKSVHQLLVSLTNGKSDKSTVKVASTNIADEAARALADARQIIIIPGYGMALAKAQFKVAELAALLSKNGTRVKFAIHPVAGRMPGHMNVILAEAEVDYDDLLEMDEVNPLFMETDAALIVGACDVVNPAAIEQEGTSISGMPILMAHEAKSIIVCNLDKKPGYSGVTNPLYENSKTILMLGDAKDSITDLISSMKSMGA